MVVDDYAVTQRMLTYQLLKQGYQVITASNGFDALESLKKTAVDLMIVDLAMPEMDGLTVLRELRANQSYHSMPIIMLTASGKEQDRQQAIRAGVDAFLTKPTSAWHLADLVENLLIRDDYQAIPA